MSLADGHIPLMRKDSSLSNDVFESVDSDDAVISHPETVPEETSSQLQTPTEEARQVVTPPRVTRDDAPAQWSLDEGIGSSISTTASKPSSSDATVREKQVRCSDVNSDRCCVQVGAVTCSDTIMVTQATIDESESERDASKPSDDKRLLRGSSTDGGETHSTPHLLHTLARHA